MTARISHTLLHRISVPFWLVAMLVAATVAFGALALLGAGDSTQPAVAADAPPPISQTSTCVDSSVGHC
jgi:hypothetical protein